MSFACSRHLFSAYDELVVVGSRWTRILAKTTRSSEVGPPHVLAHLALPKITIIPTLHVASIKFYDRVLEYVDQATRRNKDTIVLLEGICDSAEAERQQMQEYQEIMSNTDLRQMMQNKADDNTLYSPQVIQEICRELGVRFDLLQSMEKTVRLQECYLKPKLAASCGLHLHNNADLDMHEVQKLLEQESARLEAQGRSLPSSVPVSQLGTFPIIRRHREQKVALMARQQCIEWLEAEIDGEVIVPWGYFHAEGIRRYIVEGNKSDTSAAAAPSEGGDVSGSSVSGAAHPVPTAIFVAADEVVNKVSFDVPKELIAPMDSDGSGQKGQ